MAEINSATALSRIPRGFSLTSARLIRLYLTGATATSSTSQSKAAGRSEVDSYSNSAVNNSFEALIAASLDTIYRYALRMTRNAERAQDLTQETVLRGWKSRGQLTNPDASKSWLLRIATNVWTDWQRKAKQQPVALFEPIADSRASIPNKLIQREQVETVLAALDELPPRQQQVVHLICIEQLSQSEVASVLSISESAVKSSLAAGRKQMRERLESVYQELCGDINKQVNS